MPARHPTARRGFVLLTVLFVLALMAIVLAGMCRTGLRRTAQASAAADELQRRWGAASCQLALLPHADDVIEAANAADPSRPPANSVHLGFSLGSQRFDVDLCDEQAKLNANGLYATAGGRAATEAALKELGGRVPPRLVPPVQPPAKKAAHVDADETPDAAGPPAVVFGSWSELFPTAGFDDLVPSSPASASTNVTCWGNGRVNVARAAPTVLRRALSPGLTRVQVDRLLAARAGRPGDALRVDALVAATGADTAATLIATDRLTVVSAVQSLWLVARGNSGVTRLAVVRDSTASDAVRVYPFQW